MLLVGTGIAIGILYLDYASTRINRIAVVESLLHGKHFKKVVDLGCGFGDFGHVLREHSDYVIGIDADPSMISYATDKNVYNELIVSDAKDFIPDQDTDLVLAIEIIEHMTKDEGIGLLNNMKNVQNMIVTTPVKFNENCYFGRKFQEHKSLWTEQDFSNMGFQTGRIPIGWMATYIYGGDIIAYKS